MGADNGDGGGGLTLVELRAWIILLFGFDLPDEVCSRLQTARRQTQGIVCHCQGRSWTKRRKGRRWMRWEGQVGVSIQAEGSGNVER